MARVQFLGIGSESLSTPLRHLKQLVSAMMFGVHSHLPSPTPYYRE